MVLANLNLVIKLLFQNQSQLSSVALARQICLVINQGTGGIASFMWLVLLSLGAKC